MTSWPALIRELDLLSGEQLGRRIAELQRELPREGDRPAPPHWPPGDPRRALCQRQRRMREADAYPAYIEHLQRAFPGARLWTHGKAILNERTRRWENAVLCEGMADLVGCVAGRYVEIEVKRGRNKQEESQRLHQLVIEAAGGIYVVSRSPEEAEALVRARL